MPKMQTVIFPARRLVAGLAAAATSAEPLAAVCAGGSGCVSAGALSDSFIPAS